MLLLLAPFPPSLFFSPSLSPSLSPSIYKRSLSTRRDSEMIFSLSHTIKNRVDPFAKKKFTSLVFKLEYMLEAIVTACMDIGKSESTYIEIAESVKARLSDLEKIENASMNH